MSTAVLATSASAVSPARRPTFVEAATGFLRVMDAGQTVLLDGVTWDEYLWFDHERDEVQSGVRLTYADGRLELMTTSFFHDGSSVRLNLFVTTLAAVLRIPHRGARRTTFRREDVEQGFEPDESYYIQNVAAVRGLREIDLTIHPPPDLIVEIDHTRSSLPKQPIYSALGVPELWRFEAGGVIFLIRQADGSYLTVPTSRAFPMVNSADVTRLVWAEPDDDTAYIETVQAWVRTLVPQQP